MASTKEYIVKNGGTGLVVRTITEQDIEILPNIVDHFASAVVRHIHDALPMKAILPEADGNVSMVALPGHQTVWSMRLTKLPLKTNYQSKDGVLWPVFDDSTSPMLTMDWTPPANMGLVLAVTLSGEKLPVMQHLVAFDLATNRSYRLPLSNLYEDCKLCHGKYPGKPTTHLEALVLAINQFNNSNWNADLYNADASKRKNTKALFSFKAEKDSFPQQPVAESWMNSCEKIANDYVTNNIMIPTL